MPTQTLEFEGTWEEILARAAELAGRRVRVTVLPEEAEPTHGEEPLTPRNQRMLELLKQRQQTPLTEEDETILQEFEQFRKEHPFSLRKIGEQ